MCKVDFGPPDKIIPLIDLSNLLKLEVIHIYSTAIKAIDFTHNVNLTYVDCSYQAITYVDFSKNVKLSNLLINNCKLTSLDVSKSKDLKYLNCDNNLDLKVIYVYDKERAIKSTTTFTKDKSAKWENK